MSIASPIASHQPPNQPLSQVRGNHLGRTETLAAWAPTPRNVPGQAQHISSQESDAERNAASTSCCTNPKNAPDSNQDDATIDVLYHIVVQNDLQTELINGHTRNFAAAADKLAETFREERDKMVRSIQETFGVVKEDFDRLWKVHQQLVSALTLAASCLLPMQLTCPRSKKEGKRPRCRSQ
jgi:hypothetical protein